MKTTLALLILVVSAAAQTAIPNAPSHVRHQWEKKQPNPLLSPFKDPFFYAGTAFHASSVIADVHHTQACERALTCVEANPGADKYGRRSFEILGVAGMNYGCSLMLSQHKKWRALCMVVPVAIGIAHWRDATNIYSSRVKP